MLQGLAADTRVITYLMAAIGVLGILAKIINQFTLHRLVKAAGNMPKSTHRLIKLVRAKYEHACMIRDSVENIDAFVEKYIYEYRGFLFRIHTWRQVEILSVWFAGILAALGASVVYFYSGFSESVYQYIAGGIAEMVLLSVVIRLTDEPYKINAIKMYMVDYLENICTFRLRRQSQREKEFIDVISGEGGKAAFQQTSASRKRGADLQENAALAYEGAGMSESDAGFEEVYPETDAETEGSEKRKRSDRGTGNVWKSGVFRRTAGNAGSGTADTVQAASDSGNINNTGRFSNDAAADKGAASSGRGTEAENRKAADREGGLSIRIEGEPRNAEGGEAARQAVRRTAGNGTDDDRPALREEAIRQILEEFLA